MILDELMLQSVVVYGNHNIINCKYYLTNRIFDNVTIFFKTFYETIRLILILSKRKFLFHIAR